MFLFSVRTIHDEHSTFYGMVQKCHFYVDMWHWIKESRMFLFLVRTIHDGYSTFYGMVQKCHYDVDMWQWIKVLGNYERWCTR